MFVKNLLPIHLTFVLLRFAYGDMLLDLQLVLQRHLKDQAICDFIHDAIEIVNMQMKIVA